MALIRRAEHLTPPPVPELVLNEKWFFQTVPPKADY